jgi:hypothetical protein
MQEIQMLHTMCSSMHMNMTQLSQMCSKMHISHDQLMRMCSKMHVNIKDMDKKQIMQMMQKMMHHSH